MIAKIPPGSLCLALCNLLKRKCSPVSDSTSYQTSHSNNMGQVCPARKNKLCVALVSEIPTSPSIAQHHERCSPTCTKHPKFRTLPKAVGDVKISSPPQGARHLQNNSWQRLPHSDSKHMASHPPAQKNCGCVCMCVHVYVCMCVRVYVCMRVCVWVCVRVYV